MALKNVNSGGKYRRTFVFTYFSQKSVANSLQLDKLSGTMNVLILKHSYAI
jgi:hypothetical protein